MRIRGRRAWIADGMLRWIRRRARDLDARELAAPCLVIAPHPDDESLACAGTILRKRAAGATVHVAFMTDGCRSHPSVPPTELARTRHGEALAATALLGIPAANIAFLDFEDGTLAHHVPSAVARLRELLVRWQPAQVFAPCPWDWHADHVASSRAIQGALEGHREIELFEYSVYLWRSWPWSPIEDFDRGRRTSATLFARFAARVTHAVEIDRELATKRSALSSHRSQMEKRDPTWWTLSDWGQGEFVARSLTTVELFRKR